MILAYPLTLAMLLQLHFMHIHDISLMVNIQMMISGLSQLGNRQWGYGQCNVTQTFPTSMSRCLQMVAVIVASPTDTNYYACTTGVMNANQYVVNGFRSNKKENNIYYQMICIGA